LGKVKQKALKIMINVYVIFTRDFNVVAIRNSLTVNKLSCMTGHRVLSLQTSFRDTSCCTFKLHAI